MSARKQHKIEQGSVPFARQAGKETRLDRLRRIKRAIRRVWDNFHAVRALRAASRYDTRRYRRASSTHGPFRSQQNLAAKITERYHAIEKGLALPSPRPCFGVEVIATILRLCDTYVRRYGEDSVSAAAYGALRSYVEFNRQVGIDDSAIPHFAEIEAAVRVTSVTLGTNGTKQMSRARVVEAVAGVGADFFATRHSTRIFSGEPVCPSDIDFAAAAAATAPAVCNRQFGTVHVWTDPEMIQKLLEIQGGARGFADQIQSLAMITVSLRNYWGAAERNQAWIDGGLFAMNFILGLHARALGTVSLNWSKTPEKDRQMREFVGLDEATGIIFLIGIGVLRDEYLVAASPRTAIPLIRH